MASCQNYQDGYYTAHRALAGEDLAVVAFLGDYIYEAGPTPTALRLHDGVAEPVTLDEYRARHALYRTDPDLQAAHAAFPWVVTLDDHEVDNNWADDILQDPASRRPTSSSPAPPPSGPTGSTCRCAAARRAREADMTLYRRLAWGDLLQLDVLDGRQYRTDQPTSVAAPRTRPRRCSAPTRRRGSTGPGPPVGPVERRGAADDGGPERPPGRPRRDLRLRQLGRVSRRPAPPARPLDRGRNPVVLTGDRHALWVCDLRRDS